MSRTKDVYTDYIDRIAKEVKTKLRKGENIDEFMDFHFLSEEDKEYISDQASRSLEELLK